VAPWLHSTASISLPVRGDAITPRSPRRTADRRTLALTFFVAQRKAEDPVVEVELPTGRYDHPAGGYRGPLDEVRAQRTAASVGDDARRGRDKRGRRG
jgi:hypothetical protein